METFSIAIDGTAASGKSTVAKLLAHKLNCSYLDTGKLYRALALDLLSRGHEDPQAWSKLDLAAHLAKVQIRLDTPPAGECRIILHNVDVGHRLNDLKVERATPYAARLPEVRDFLLDVQRNLAKESSVVMAGRDIGTVVLPDATLKVFIEAELQERARRRLIQHEEHYTKEELEEAAEALRKRDEADANRQLAPMSAAKDAVRLDSTNCSAEQLVEDIVRVLNTRLASA
ncbi:MAG: (d)CMP kinase [Candidatus Eremiobacteraeota bacterium]|nr:(d)CMP kinase [Candidatus Eremiobacteraeota bacterium]